MKHARRRRAPTAASPVPPSRSPFLSRHERLVQAAAVVALASGAIYLVWRIGWSGSGISPPLFLALLGAELFGWISLAFYAFLAWRVPPARTPSDSWTGSVDIFVCTYDESVAVVESTLVGCRAIPNPHVTYLLDDGRRPEMADLAERLGASYVTRPDNEHAKAGNINHALGCTDGDLILMLDADHVPLPSILSETVDYFADPSVALVQTPHDFSNRDSAQHTRPGRHEQSLFYDVIAPGKDRHNAMFWCGSATVVRRDALVEVGGVLTDTVAEDFHTTIAMHARGWRTRYHNVTLVQGRAPHDLAGFLLQRARWARGNLGVFRTKENPVTCRGLTLAQRTSYLGSLLNYFGGLQRLALLMILIVVLVTGSLPMRASIVTLGALWLPWSIMAFVATLALARGNLGSMDSTRYGLLSMGIQIRAIVALASSRTGVFKVTPKDGVDEGGWRVLRMLGLLCVVGVALAVAWVLRVLDVAGVLTLPPMPVFAMWVVIVLGAWELFSIGYAVIPSVRRRQFRTRFRAPTSMSARINGTTIRVAIADLTPEGLAFSAPIPFEVGSRLCLLTRVPDTTGELHDVSLPVEVRSNHSIDNGAERVGCRIIDLDQRAHHLLVEFCDVVLPTQQLDPTTRVGRVEEQDGTAASDSPPEARPGSDAAARGL